MLLNTIASFLPKNSKQNSPFKNAKTSSKPKGLSKPNVMLNGFYSFEEQQQKMSKDIEKYILKSSEYSEDEIESIIQQYSPNTNFRKIKNSDFEFYPLREVKAQTIQKFEVLPKPNNSGYSVHKFPQYVNAAFPSWLTKKERVLFAARLIHEFTHVLQEDLIASQGIIPLIEKFVSENKKLSKIDLTIEAAAAIYNYIELDMTQKFKEILHSSDYMPAKISDKISLDWLFFKLTRRNIEDDLNKTFIQMYRQLQNSVNWNLIHDYITIRARSEAVAYQKELDFLRKHTSIGTERCDFDLKIEMYEKIATSSTKLKLRNIKQKKPLK